MRTIIAFTLALAAVLAAASLGSPHLDATPRARATGIAPRDSMCDPQTANVSTWKAEMLPVMTFRHPKDYVIGKIDTSFHLASYVYRGNAAHRHGVVVGWLGKYDSLQMFSAPTPLSVCIAVIGNRPATLSTYGHPDPTLVIARWASFRDLPPVYMALGGDRTALAQMRQLFWTVQFPGLKPDTSEAFRCATPIRPRGELSDFLDTALVSTLAQSLWAGMPRGYTIVELSFDSTGDVGAVEVLAGDLSEKSQKDLAVVLSSNAKTQPKSTPPAAVRMEVTDKGYAFQLIPVSACPKK